MNEAIITQAGRNHEGRVQQNGAGNISFIDQSGSNHFAAEQQLFGYSNNLSIVQTGGDGVTGVGGRNKARVRLRGDLNEAEYLQDGNGNDIAIEARTGAQNDNNTFDAIQIGDMNDADIDFAEASSFNTVDLDQNGTGNFADIDVDGSNNMSIVTQN